MNEPRPNVKLVKLVPAPPKVVFGAWLDPMALRRFMCPAEGTSVTRAEVDARVGGKFAIVMRIAGQDRLHHGEYVEIVPFERLVFSWLSHVAGQDSRVVLIFEPAASGHTRLTLEHFGLEGAEALRSHESGWGKILNALEALELPLG